MDMPAVRQRLEAEKARLQGVLDAAGRGQGTQEGGKPDQLPAEQAAETLNRELDSSVELRVRTELAEVEAALHRLDVGRYGLCEVCGGRDRRGAPGGDAGGALLRGRPGPSRARHAAARRAVRPGLHSSAGRWTRALEFGLGSRRHRAGGPPQPASRALAPAGAAGSWTVKVEPSPSTEVAVTSPPRRLTSSRQR